MRNRRIICVCAALLLLSGCGKVDNKGANNAEAIYTGTAASGPAAAAADTSASPDESAAAQTTKSNSKPDTSSAPTDSSLYVVETHGSREYDGAADRDDFADTLFIGDSRTVGLMLNGNKPKAEYFATPGLNIMTAQTTPVVPKSDFGLVSFQAQAYTEDNTWDYGWGDDTQNDVTWDDAETNDWGQTETEDSSEEEASSEDDNLMTIPDALSYRQYRRVFINFGVNELGWPSPEIFVERYKLLVLQVRSAQPNAAIYIESMLPVSYLAYANIDTCYTTENVDNFNKNYIRRVAEETNCIYLDVNQFFRDSRGDLFYEASTDGIHLTRDYCLEWMDILAYYTGGGGDIRKLTDGNALVNNDTQTASEPDVIIPYSQPDVIIPGDSSSESYDNGYTDNSYDDHSYDSYDDYTYDYGYNDYDYDYDNDYGDYDYDYGYDDYNYGY